MLRFLGRHKVTITGFILLTLPLVSLWYHGRERTEATVYERTIARMTSPALGGMATVINTVHMVWTDYLWLVGVQNENRKLRESNDQLAGMFHDREQLKKENKRLKSLLSFKGDRPDLVTIAARVVAKDVSPFHRVLKIKLSAGANHGVRRYHPVVSPSGVVGHVEKIVGEYAEVKLAVDSGSRISVDVVGGDTKGTVVGSGDRNMYVASFVTMNPRRKVRNKSMLVTNGEDERYPKGLVVGYVSNALPRSEDGGYQYEVIPAVPFATLEEVLIVISRIERIPSIEARQ